MRKPSFKLFEEFKRVFDKINREEGLRQQLIPYFISSHPGCHEEDMADLAIKTKRLDFQLEQVQDFTPTPMTVSTETWYSGYDPYTLEPVFSAKTPKDKLAQRQFFFWYKPEERRNIEQSLRRIGRADLIKELIGKQPLPQPSPVGREPEREKRYKANNDKNRWSSPSGTLPTGEGGGRGRNKPKSYNPNFQNENRRKPDNRKAKSGDVRGRNHRDR
jgi:hypothetical protein